MRPVSFRYKKALDPKGVPQFGPVAEEVAEVDADLVLVDSNGKPLTVRYDEVNAMLLNEFLKEHRKVTDKGEEIAKLRATVTELKSALLEQAAQIRRVHAQVTAKKKPAQITSAND